MNNKILILDHEASFSKTLQSILLGELECQVEIIYPDENIEKFIQEYKPKFILATSWRQEKLIKIIKNNSWIKNIPVILISYYYSSNNESPCSADDYIPKPVDITEFLVKMQKNLR